MVEDESDVIRSDKAAVLLGVSQRALYEWIREEPSMPHWKTSGGQLRFSRSRLIKWRDSGAGRKERAS